MKLKVLLRTARRTGEKAPLKMVETTLNRMARGGIYDHLGGGFHRYSTDQFWLVPHFEKMLYNQALMAEIYLEGFQETGNIMYESVARGILDYVLRDMTSSEGGFYSAEDADSEGEEGTFYVWSHEELKKILTPKELEKVSQVYGVSPQGQFNEGGRRTNIFHLQAGVPWEIKNDPEVRSIREKLLRVRNKRPRPFKDDKVVVSWNGMMLASMAQAYKISAEPKYLRAAQKAARFLQKELVKDGKLSRRYREGEAKHAASLDDYAFLIQGLITLYESDFNEAWMVWAIRLQEKQDQLFWDAEEGGYYLAEADNLLPFRKKEFSDGARPNSNAVSALNLLKLYNFTFEKRYLENAEKIFTVVADRMAQIPHAHGQMLVALDFYLDQSKEIAVVGPRQSKEKDAIIKALRSAFIPNKVLAFNETGTPTSLPVLQDKYSGEGKTTVYVCENNICKYPTGNLEKIQELVGAHKPFDLQ